MKQLLLALALFTLSQYAFSKPLELSSCSDVGVKIENILLGAENQMSFYNGKVGMVIYDMMEPVTASFGIVIIHDGPEVDGLVTRKCMTIPYLSGVNFKDANTTSDAGGLTIIVNVRMTDGFAGETRDAKIAINIKLQMNGRIREGYIVNAEEI